VTERDGERADVLAASFVAGGGSSHELSEPPEGDGTSIQAAASMRIATGERTLWAGGAVLGYIERLGRRTVGTLRLSHEGLAFVEDGGRVHSWALEDVRALQGSSSTVQISPATGGVVSFRLRSDSSRRWEDLLKDRLRALWREQGRGEIVEFQPRIRSW
jgi:hypothetical protein